MNTIGERRAIAADGVDNRNAVIAELNVLRAIVRSRGMPDDCALAPLEEALEKALLRLDGPSTLDEIAEGFGLTRFERAVLLLAAGPELVGAVADELHAAIGTPRLTFGDALNMLPEPHWSAVTPIRPLRRWRLVRLTERASPTRSELVVDERILHHLAGAGYLDTELAARARPVASPLQLPSTLAAPTHAIVDAWQNERIAVLRGSQRGNLDAVMAAAARTTGLELFELRGEDLLGDAATRYGLVRQLERETVLGRIAWSVDAADQPSAELAEIFHLLRGTGLPLCLIVAGTETRAPSGAVEITVDRLPIAERREQLRAAVRSAGAGANTSDEELDRAAGVFDLSLDDLAAAAEDVAAGTTVWTACRRRARRHPGTLARAVSTNACWEDLVLPHQLIAQLHALVASVRYRPLVLDSWGFARRGSRGLSTTALFAGPSGTGKTLAAEVVAHELDLDLLRVDLSQVMSKWIGETEKHLAAVFDAAEDGGSVLLFDEADALFGKRSAVRDSHDRYANLEVAYLLQRIEEFRGLAILTTNARDSLDPAFTRRIGYVLTFPHPDAAAREALWHGAFPADADVADLDRRGLAAIDLPGGSIASIALVAAYLGAEEGTVTQRHVRTAAQWELIKNGRTVRTAAGASE